MQATGRKRGTGEMSVGPIKKGTAGHFRDKNIVSNQEVALCPYRPPHFQKFAGTEKQSRQHKRERFIDIIFKIDRDNKTYRTKH
jgi:hypothetical protein